MLRQDRATPDFSLTIGDVNIWYWAVLSDRGGPIDLGDLSTSLTFSMKHSEIDDAIVDLSGVVGDQSSMLGLAGVEFTDTSALIPGIWLGKWSIDHSASPVELIKVPNPGWTVVLVEMGL